MDDGRCKYLTPRDVADYSSLSRRTVYDLIYRGDLRAHKFGRSLRVAKDELRQYERESDWRIW